MGITKETIEFLNSNKEIIKNKNVLMIGRQVISYSKNTADKFGLKTFGNIYSEKLWLELGVKSIKSIDFSNYEKPNYIHDMNKKISKDLEGKFDIIFDGGATEHMYNVPEVIKNYKKMLSKGGFYIGILPTNNYTNHGFYQFSPDLFYRTFSKEYGYKTSIFFNDGFNWAYIKDIIEFNFPNNTNLIMSNKPTLMYIISKKINDKIDNNNPIQTIYGKHLWKNKTNTPNKNINFTILKYIKKIIPNILLNYIYNKKMISEIIIKTNDLKIKNY